MFYCNIDFSCWYIIDIFIYFRCTSSLRGAAKLNNRILLSLSDKLETDHGSSIRQYHEVTGDIITPSQIMGIDHLRDPRLNKVKANLNTLIIIF